MNDDIREFMFCHPDIFAEFILWQLKRGHITPADVQAIFEKAQVLQQEKTLAEFDQIAQAAFAKLEE